MGDNLGELFLIFDTMWFTEAHGGTMMGWVGLGHGRPGSHGQGRPAISLCQIRWSIQIDEFPARRKHILLPVGVDLAVRGRVKIIC